jgi:hypothetical protein
MATKKLHLDWPLLNALGQPISTELLHDWFDAKPAQGEWMLSKSKGVSAVFDHHHRLTAWNYYTKGIEPGAKEYVGELPGTLTWATSRAQARKIFGPPESSGEVGGVGLMAIEFSWDRWHLDTGAFIRCEYAPNDASIRQIQLQEPPQREPTSSSFAVYASHMQFYVADRSNTCDIEALWDNPDASPRQFAVGEGLVAIGTKRFGTVPVRIEWYPTEPKLDPRGIDRINEGGLTISTKLVVGNYVNSNDLPEVPGITPGSYGLRAIYLHQKDVVSDDDGRDEYIIQLWPVSELPPLHYIKPR